MVNLFTYLEIFLEDIDRRIYLGEFEDHFKRSHQTIRSHLDKLVKKNVLEEQKLKRLRFYRINQDNPLTLEYLSLCEKQRLLTFLEKPLFRNLYRLINQQLPKHRLLIFGSSVSNKKFSDIDLLDLSKGGKLRKILKQFELTYGVPVHYVQTSKKNMTDTLRKEIIKKHIILNKHDFFVRMLYGK